jgi:hypothetical protein
MLRPHLSEVIVVAAVVAALAVYLLVHYDVFGSSTHGATVGSGTAVSVARTVAPFRGVELAGSNNVTVQAGRRRSVVVHADDNLVKRVTTAVHAGRLVIGNTPGSFSSRSPMWVTVTTPSVDAVILSGSGNIDVGDVSSPKLSVTLVGSGNVRASGSTRTLTVTIPGSGTAQLGQLTARDVTAAVSGSGEISLTAKHSLDARVSGSGAIFYGGNPPHLKTSITGSGAITPLS